MVEPEQSWEPGGQWKRRADLTDARCREMRLVRAGKVEGTLWRQLAGAGRAGVRGGGLINRSDPTALIHSLLCLARRRSVAIGSGDCHKGVDR